MPSPTAALATLRPDLAGSFMEFELEAQRRGFIAADVFPVLEVKKASGLFGKFTIEQLLQEPDTLRAPGAAYNQTKTTFSKDTFATVEHGLQVPVDDNEAAMYAEFFDAEQLAASRAIDGVLRAAEKRVADAVFNTTTWTGSALTTAITNEWDDATNATPRADVKAAMVRVWNNSGLLANALIINHQVFDNLIDVDEIISRLKFAGITDPRPGMITREALAQALGIQQVIVGRSPRASNKHGQSTTIASIWDDEYAMVGKVATSQDVKEPCIGRIFHWGEDGSSPSGTIESYRNEDRRSDMIRVRQQVDEKTLYAEAGHLLSNITS